MIVRPRWLAAASRRRVGIDLAVAALLGVGAMLGGCQRTHDDAPTPAAPQPPAAPPSAPATAPSEPAPSPLDAGKGGGERPPTTARGARFMAEVQAIVEGGADPAKLSRLIGAHAADADALVARKAALYVLKAINPPETRLAALIDAAASSAQPPGADPLWPELVDAMAETWSSETSAAGRRRMLRERDPRVRRLLVASMARYAGSSRGLSNLGNSARRALRAELRSVYPKVDPDVRRDIDATVPKLVHDDHVLD